MSIISDMLESKKHYGGVTLAERMAACHTPAVSIAVVENWKISAVYAHGVKRRTRKEKVTADTLFQAASISKAVFAAAVMRLVEKGTLALDADVSEYLVGYEVPVYNEQKHTVTLRQLLSHHAGLNLHGFAGYRQGKKIPTVEQMLTGAYPSNHIALALEKAPESGFQYSGGGYVLAQKIVTDVCGQDFCDLMDTWVLAPFSMARSTYAQPLPQDRREEMAVGYDQRDAQLPGGYNVMPELSAAGLWTKPSDLAGFGIEIMKALKGESKVLEKNTAELMTTAAYENSPYGLGVAVGSCQRGLVFGHGGSNIGYHSNMLFCPGDGSGMVVMQNADIGKGIRDEVTQAFRDICGW